MRSFLILFLLSSVAFARIEDNSFLLEEAFNQDLGVHQFIQGFQRFEGGKQGAYFFEHELPVYSPGHQLAYFIPYETVEGELQDIYLSYRYQPYNKNGLLHAERFSLILPTGQVKDGAGYGVVGLEFMHATSMALNEKWMGHLNAGFNYFPEAKTAEGFRKTLLSPVFGLSAIYLLSENFNLMLEGLYGGERLINEEGITKTNETLTLSPGFRVDLFPDMEKNQIVAGLAFPVEVLNYPREHSIFLYLSVEPDFN